MTSNMDTKRMVKLLETLAKYDGVVDSLLDNVQFIQSGKHLPRHSIVYEPFIFILAQGRKKVFLGDEIYSYDPSDGKVLGPQVVREIVYRLLCDEHGEALRLLAVRHGRFSQMAKVLNRIHTDFDAKLFWRVLFQ